MTTYLKFCGNPSCCTYVSEYINDINDSNSGWTDFCTHDDVIKCQHYPRYWPFVREIHRSPVNSLHKGQWRGALLFSLICAWINACVNSREAGDLRRYRAHYDVSVMYQESWAGELWPDQIKISFYGLQCFQYEHINCFWISSLQTWKWDFGSAHWWSGVILRTFNSVAMRMYMESTGTQYL